MSITVQQFDNIEVCIWLVSIGLGSKISTFKENDIDGDLLCSLDQEDLTSDLGLSNLEAKRVIRSIETAKVKTNDNSHDERIAHFLTKNEEFQYQIASLESQVKALEAANNRQSCIPAPIPQQQHRQQHYQAPQPPQQQQQQQPTNRGPGVIEGAAFGAAGGAAMGAIAGRVLPRMRTKDGARAGAAVGAFAGGMRGIGNRVR